MKTNKNNSIPKRMFQLGLICLLPINGIAQPSSETLSKMLTAVEYENVRVAATKSITLVSLEDNLYRWNIDGGFHFSISLPPSKRNRRHPLRLASPRYFDGEYNAGTEFYYGRYYETRSNENRSERWINPIFIKNELLKEKTK